MFKELNDYRKEIGNIKFFVEMFCVATFIPAMLLLAELLESLV